MNDSQIVTVEVAVCVPLGLLFLSNSRLTDVKEALRAEIKLTENKLEHRIDTMEAKLDRAFERMDSKLDTVLKILADHETRLAK